MKKNIIFLFILLLTASHAIYAQTSVTAELDSAQILIGDQAVFSIKVVSPKNAEVKLPTYKQGGLLAKGLEIIDIKNDTAELSGDERQITKSLAVSSWDEGTYTIAPQTIVIAGKQYQTKKKTLKVITMEVDTLHPEQIKPAKDVIDNPFSLLEWVPVIAWLLVTVLLVISLRYLNKLLKSNKRLFPSLKPAKKLLPHEKALLSIEKIKEEEQSKTIDQKTYYTQLTDTLREYLEERFSINAKEMTSGEIVERLMAEEDMTKVDELKELFTTADLVKFAKFSTQNNESAMYLANVAQFVEETKREEQPPLEPSEAEKKEEERQNKRQRRIIRTLMACVVVAIIAILLYVVWTVYELLM